LFLELLVLLDGVFGVSFSATLSLPSRELFQCRGSGCVDPRLLPVARLAPDLPSVFTVNRPSSCPTIVFVAIGLPPLWLPMLVIPGGTCCMRSAADSLRGFVMIGCPVARHRKERPEMGLLSKHITIRRSCGRISLPAPLSASLVRSIMRGDAGRHRLTNCRRHCFLVHRPAGKAGLPGWQSLAWRVLLFLLRDEKKHNWDSSS